MFIIHPSNRMLGRVLDGKMSEKTSLTSRNLHHSSRYKSFKPKGKLLPWGQSDKLGQKSLQGRWDFPLLRKSLLSFLFINLKSFGSASYISPLDRKKRVLSADKQGWPCWVTGIQAGGLRGTPCLPITLTLLQASPKQQRDLGQGSSSKNLCMYTGAQKRCLQHLKLSEQTWWVAMTLPVVWILLSSALMIVQWRIVVSALHRGPKRNK